MAIFSSLARQSVSQATSPAMAAEAEVPAEIQIRATATVEEAAARISVEAPVATHLGFAGEEEAAASLPAQAEASA